MRRLLNRRNYGATINAICLIKIVKIKDGKVKKVESTSYSYGEEGNLIKIYLPLGQKYEVKVNNLISASLYRFDPLLDSYTLIEEFAKDILINK